MASEREKGKCIMKRISTIKGHVYSLLACISIFCVGVVFFSALSTNRILELSDKLFDANRALTDFYYHVNEMDASVREWMYSDKPENLEQYRRALQDCRDCLQKIYDNGDPVLTRRFHRLENMIENYKTRVDRYVLSPKTSINTLDAYRELSYHCTLIDNTASKFHGYLADFIETNAQKIQADWRSTVAIQVMLIIGFAILGILFDSYASSQILVPIHTMQQNANRVRQGNFTLAPVESAARELDELARAFSQMADQVRENMDVITMNAQLEQKLMQQEREQLSMQNLVIQTELRSLQSQINPHFLFNTLSMISKSAYLSHDDGTSELINRLSSFLRYALDKSSTISTLQEEVDSISDYFYIQERRFGDRLTFSVDMGRDVPNVPIPAIILQPLVENAVKHGMGEEGMHISLKARMKKQNVVLKIEDDGVGIPPEQLEKLQSWLRMGLDSTGTESGTSIGLTNVYRRLRMYYGEGLQFSIESEVGCGTLITITIPQEDRYEA